MKQKGRKREKGRKTRGRAQRGYIFTAFSLILFMSVLLLAVFASLNSRTMDTRSAKIGFLYDDLCGDLLKILNVSVSAYEEEEGGIIAIHDCIPSGAIREDLGVYKQFVEENLSRDMGVQISLSPEGKFETGPGGLGFRIGPYLWYLYDNLSKSSVYVIPQGNITPQAYSITIELSNTSLGGGAWSVSKGIDKGGLGVKINVYSGERRIYEDTANISPNGESWWRLEAGARKIEIRAGSILRGENHSLASLTIKATTPVKIKTEAKLADLGRVSLIGSANISIEERRGTIKKEGHPVWFINTEPLLFQSN